MIVIIGVVVVGPQRLPEVVRTILVTLRKIRRMFSDVKDDISRELDLDDMRKFIHEADMKAHIDKLNQSVMDMTDDVQTSTQAVTESLKEAEQTIEQERQALKQSINAEYDVIPDGETVEENEQAWAEADTGIEDSNAPRFDHKPTDNNNPPTA